MSRGGRERVREGGMPRSLISVCEAEGSGMQTTVPNEPTALDTGGL
jgi:hypothetical protein